MQYLEPQLQMDGILTKKCQESDKKVTTFSMNILVDKDLSVGINLWISDVHIVAKKTWVTENTELVASKITQVPIRKGPSGQSWWP